MKKRIGVKLEGFTNTWSEISTIIRDGKRYYLMENDIYGDETHGVVIDAENNIICTTYDDIQTALDDMED